MSNSILLARKCAINYLNGICSLEASARLLAGYLETSYALALVAIRLQADILTSPGK